MDEIETLLNRMRELESKVRIHGPASNDAIRALETAFGRTLPPSFWQFLERFGAVSIVGRSFSGVIRDQIDGGKGWAWTDTKAARDFCQLPEHYLVVEAADDGYMCLDFSRTTWNGEHPVIYHVPFRDTPFQTLAPNYGAWLRDHMIGMVEAWEDDVDDEADLD